MRKVALLGVLLILAPPVVVRAEDCGDDPGPARAVTASECDLESVLEDLDHLRLVFDHASCRLLAANSGGQDPKAEAGEDAERWSSQVDEALRNLVEPSWQEQVAECSEKEAAGTGGEDS